MPLPSEYTDCASVPRLTHVRSNMDLTTCPLLPRSTAGIQLLGMNRDKITAAPAIAAPCPTELETLPWVKELMAANAYTDLQVSKNGAAWPNQGRLHMSFHSCSVLLSLKTAPVE